MSQGGKKQSYESVDRDVLRRYRVGTRIGRGCYGVVFQAMSVSQEETSAKFAVKKVHMAFKNSVDAQRTYREVMYQLEFSNHHNILSLHDVLPSMDDRHLYLASDLFDSDLQKALRCQALGDMHKPLVSYQIMCALKYMHSAHVMHRDVKPANILINQSCRANLCDFGWARAAPTIAEMEVCQEGMLTEYATTRWYRSPEQLLGSRTYGVAIDVWALGCVTGEMHGHGPLLNGTSTIDMLDKIIEITGKPTPMDIVALDAPYADYSLSSLPNVPAHKPLEGRFPQEPFLVDFLQLILQINPEKRLTASEALTHPYLGNYHNPGQEPMFGRRIVLALPDNEAFTAAQYRDQIYADVVALQQAKRRVADRQRRARQEE